MSGARIHTSIDKDGGVWLYMVAPSGRRATLNLGALDHFAPIVAGVLHEVAQHEAVESGRIAAERPADPGNFERQSQCCGASVKFVEPTGVHFCQKCSRICATMIPVPVPVAATEPRTSGVGPAVKLRPYDVRELPELLGVRLARQGGSQFIPTDTASMDADLLLAHCTFVEGPMAGQRVGKPVNS